MSMKIRKQTKKVEIQESSTPIVEIKVENHKKHKKS